MRIVHLTPGAGSMFCGNCLHDNTLVMALRQLDHEVTLLPLYLPLTVDEEDQSRKSPLFFNGINVYLEQKSALYRQAPGWVHQLFNSRELLKWAGDSASKTAPEDLGDLTISMLRGEEGNQARELEQLIDWLKKQKEKPPQLLVLSNVLLAGLARSIQKELNLPVVCLLQGEDYYLDHLPQPQREQAWETVRERAADIELFIAPSRYFAQRMQKRLSLDPCRLRVVHNGIHLHGFENLKPRDVGAPQIGYFARMCPEKGLDFLIDAFIALKADPDFKNVRLKVGGSCGKGDEAFVAGQKGKLKSLEGSVSFLPNLSRDEKITFLSDLDLFSVPALYGEGFGLYLLEAMAAGVPLVQPDHAAFPEIIEKSRGGVLFKPDRPLSLARAWGELLRDPQRRQSLGQAGRQAVEKHFNADRMARETAQAYELALSKQGCL